ncbi:MAG: GNAT family N-acetyltransferase, partial [Oscillospiraceae bacterium]|nr:GNAT family N-acetyltransferase [Oscillospiraceae bacterium]
MVIEIIQREIATRGMGYIILRDCPEERLGEALGKGMEKLKKAGAQTVLATSLPEGEPLHTGPVGVWRLTHAHDMVSMERSLPAEKPELKLSLRAPRRGQEETLYLNLTNRAFAQVPNAATQRPIDLRRPNHRYGLAYQGDTLVGTYELDLSEKTPELCSLAVEPELWRQGYGRALLRAVLESLGAKTPCCTLTVSTANLPALELYQSEGFTQTGVVSDWYEV